MKFLVIKKSLIAFVLCFCLLLGVYIIPGSGSDNVASVFFGNTSGRRIPIYGVETEKKQIAISRAAGRRILAFLSINSGSEINISDKRQSRT